jgi:hypothetical protein
MYDLIIGKQTMHDLGVKLDFQEKTITIDKILLPMRNIANLQLKPRITRALRENTCFGSPVTCLSCPLQISKEYVPRVVSVTICSTTTILTQAKVGKT